MRNINIDIEKNSERVFWVVQTIFGFIIGQSFYNLAPLYIPPFSDQLLTVSLAAISVYLCVFLSWISFSYTLIKNPYQFNGDFFEKLRFLTDLIIVGLYSYIVVDVEKINSSPDGNHQELFAGFALIFIFYIMSGLLRRKMYGKEASHIGVLAIYSIVFSIIYLLYSYFYSIVEAFPNLVNQLFFFVLSITTIIYRSTNMILHKRKKNYSIAVDIDGVLGDQITSLLPIINNEFKLNLKFEDIVEWALPIADTNLYNIILEQQKHKNFILRIPIVNNGGKVLKKLYKSNYINIVTARNPETDTWTKQWLQKNNLPFDSYESSKEGRKQNTLTKNDILIDDYEKNIIEFLKNSNGNAILFSQPWNSDHSVLEPFIQQKRVIVANNWKEIPQVIRTLKKRQKDNLNI